MKFSPMLAKLGDKKDLSKKGYLWEPKLDGTRAICYVNKEIKLINRRGRNITYRYPEFDFRKNIDAKNCILDGEIIVYDKKGNPNFNLLQSREQLDKKIMIELRSKQYPATYVVFDILMKDGRSLIDIPLIKRKEILDDMVSDGKGIQKIFFTKDSRKLWKEVTKRKLEGIMAKNENSKYYPGRRVPPWLKVKYLKTIDCIIVGYTHRKRIISALAVGVYSEGKLIYIGRVGTGFTEEFLENLYEKLEKIEIKKAPVEYSGKETIHWVKPLIVCEVRYLQFSKDKIMRAPAFLRLRFDKLPKECILEEQVK
jgi:DNA ligase D-like protein (predicted ligase)